ncbi:adhesion G-protein coupled receptor G5-like [Protopterus annectens]|uniref:adhesion G-protein coupled receptor G5-like n=1 Tax=Protopterus annectens TaxID=7888 RepID=UPI001CF96754|nr:adhesion G-protein coupled receptor G5-like [Protopterus annectens]
MEKLSPDHSGPMAEPEGTAVPPIWAQTGKPKPLTQSLGFPSEQNDAAINVSSGLTETAYDGNVPKPLLNVAVSSDGACQYHDIILANKENHISCNCSDIRGNLTNFMSSAATHEADQGFEFLEELIQRCLYLHMQCTKEMDQIYKYISFWEDDFMGEFEDKEDTDGEYDESIEHCKTKKGMNVMSHVRSFLTQNFRDTRFIINSTTISTEEQMNTISSGDGQNMNIEIMLPKEVFQKAKNYDKAKIALTWFNKSNIFKVNSNSQLLHDTVIGVSMWNATISDLNQPFTMTFNHKPRSNNETRECVFWDMSKGKQKGWNSDGCKTYEEISKTICECTHLTFFAVLLIQSTTASMPLTYISYVGCGISAGFALFTILLYLLTRHQLKCDNSTAIHINLSVALLLLNLTFLLNSWLASFNIDGLCRFIAIFMHFSLIGCFSWMGLEGFHLYLMIRKVYNICIKFYLLKLCLIGWGIPALMITVIGPINNPSKYGRISFTTGDNQTSSSMCWILDPLVLYITNWGYLGLIFIFNTAVLGLVCYEIHRLRCSNKMMQEKTKWWKDMLTIFGLVCLLGSTWVMAFFAFDIFKEATMYIFTILNSLQGGFLFVWFLLNHSARVKINASEERTKSISSPHPDPPKIKLSPLKKI